MTSFLDEPITDWMLIKKKLIAVFKGQIFNPLVDFKSIFFHFHFKSNSE